MIGFVTALCIVTIFSSYIPLFKLCERDYIASFSLKDLAQGVYVTAGRIAIDSE